MDTKTSFLGEHTPFAAFAPPRQKKNLGLESVLGSKGYPIPAFSTHGRGDLQKSAIFWELRCYVKAGFELMLCLCMTIFESTFLLEAPVGNVQTSHEMMPCWDPGK